MESKTSQIIKETEAFSAHNYHPLELVIERGSGVWVWDVEGKKYMDMLSAYSALNQGHLHPSVTAVLKKQADRLTLTSRAFHNEWLGKFCRKLAQLSEMEMVLPMNTGAEAVETAIKIMRKWAYAVKGIEMYKAEIIVCNNNFHGRTTTIISFSTEKLYKHFFGPFTPGFRVVEYGNIEEIEKNINANTCGLLVEPIQGEAGIIIPPDGYLKQLRQLCNERKILLALDEIQTGLGRTGRLFCYQHENAKPDILIVGKALGGGVIPISAVVSSKQILGLFTSGEHGSTFGGNPLACAVAIEALNVIVREKLPERARQLGSYFMEKLKKIKNPLIKEIRGKGLLIGMELTKEAGGARKWCEKLATQGLLCKETHEDVVRFAPPLIIKREEIDWAMEKINQVFSK